MTKSKYGNKKITAFGLKFDSRGEYQRYTFLKDAENRGLISNLKCQVPFKIDVNGMHICKYIADFTYLKKDSLELIIEDFKSEFTRKNPIYRLKKKLMEASFGIIIREALLPTENIT